LTLVRVGPVTRASPRAVEKPVTRRCRRGVRRAACMPQRPGTGQTCPGRAKAPATSSSPSTPSVSPATAWTCRDAPARATARASRNSTLRPPRPLPRTVTVVSPPESRTQGAASGWPWPDDLPGDGGHDLGHVARLALDGVAEDQAPPRRPWRATAAAASRAICGVAIRMGDEAGQTRVARFEGFAGGRFRGGRARLTGRQFDGVTADDREGVGAGSWGRRPSGPEAMSTGWSPGTSEISRFTTRAGWQAAARRPPLIAERWRRTQFISEIVAPDLSSALVDRLLVVQAEALARQGQAAPSRRRKSGRAPVSSALEPAAPGRGCAAAAASPAASGTGWAASTISMRWQGTA
jgi:hypothetical protein